MIEFPCPHCKVNISAESCDAGATASCPSCGQDLMVPSDHDQLAISHLQAYDSQPVDPPSIPSLDGSTSQAGAYGASKSAIYRINWIPALVFMSIGSVLAWILSYQYTNLVSVKPSAGELVVIIALFMLRPIFWAILHYKCWIALPEQYRATTPGRAVGFLFIPFFNFYWAFVSWPKLSQGMVDWQSEEGLKPIKTGALGLTYAILFVCVYTIGLVPGLGILIGVAQLVIFIIFYKKITGGINLMLSRVNRVSCPRRRITKMIKIGALAATGILVLGAFIAAVSSNSGKSKSRASSSAPISAPQSKQKTNRAGYNAYMTGYDNPEQGDVAEAMIDRFSGGDRQAALLMILGAEDRRKGLPIRFVVVRD